METPTPLNTSETKIEKNEQLPELTDQNFLFLKHIQEGKTVRDAYELAGYVGARPNAPYEFYSKLKKRLQAVVEADTIDGLRLRQTLSDVIKLPRRERDISNADLLKAVKLAHDITEGTNANRSQQPHITAFIVERYRDIPPSLDTPKANGPEVIDIDPLP